MLVNYGIQNEESDWRAHVSVCNSTVYLFMTCAGLQALKSGKYNMLSAYTGKIQTAIGAAVPISDIFGMASIPIPSDLLKMVKFRAEDDTSAKGIKAVRVVLKMMRRGILAHFEDAEYIRDVDMQINGTDIQAGNCRIQVKCDWYAGMTGNLYLQTAERNLFKQF